MTRRLSTEAHTFAVVMATGGVALGSLWVVATATVLVSRTFEASKRRQLSASVPVSLEVVGRTLADREATR